MAFTIEHNVSLRLSNTMGIDVLARYYCRVLSLQDLAEALVFARDTSLEVVVLGSGSNVVLTRDIEGLVINIGLKGVEISDHRLTAMAGESWHQLVNLTIDQGLYGLENLSFIPGLVGAAPIQNIGAYGVELSERFVMLTALDRRTGDEVVVDRDDCRFGYRDSVFKHRLKDSLVIVSVTLELDSQFEPRLKYGDLASQFADSSNVTARQVADAVIGIRSRKLPDPAVVGNAGSFFKNPEVSTLELERIQRSHPDVFSMGEADGKHKLSAAALINQAGLIGLRVGDASVSTQHALVITNQDKATGDDVMTLAKEVVLGVKNRFDLLLEIEPVVMT